MGRVLTAIVGFDRDHPYFFSFILATIILGATLFYTSSVKINQDYKTPEKIDFVDIDTFQTPKRVVKKTITTEKTEAVPETPVERAKGTSELDETVDLAFFPNITPPKPIGSLKKIYPKDAKIMNIEATLLVEILINRQGIVVQVKILRTRLSKELPGEAYHKIAKSFEEAARKILLGARFTSPIVDGKKVPIKMEQPLQFRLNS